MSTKQKERLISLLLSLWFELAIRLSEKDGLTLFFPMVFLLHWTKAKLQIIFGLDALKKQFILQI